MCFVVIAVDSVFSSSFCFILGYVYNIGRREDVVGNLQLKTVSRNLFNFQKPPLLQWLLLQPLFHQPHQNVHMVRREKSSVILSVVQTADGKSLDFSIIQNPVVGRFHTQDVRNCSQVGKQLSVVGVDLKYRY